MLKFTASHAVTGNVLGLGLSEENVIRLKQGKPILIKSEELKTLTGWQGEIILFYGKTEKEMEKELSEFVGTNTKIVRPDQN